MSQVKKSGYGRIETPKYKGNFSIDTPMQTEESYSVPETEENQASIWSGTTFKTTDIERAKKAKGKDELVHDVGQVVTLENDEGMRVGVIGGVADGQGSHRDDAWDAFVTERASRAVDMLQEGMQKAKTPDEAFEAIPGILDAIEGETPLAKQWLQKQNRRLTQVDLEDFRKEKNITNDQEWAYIQEYSKTGIVEEKDKDDARKKQLRDMLDRKISQILLPGMSLEDQPQTTLSVFRTFPGEGGKNVVVGVNVGDSMVVAWNPATKTFRTLGEAAVDKNTGMPVKFPNVRDKPAELRFKEEIDDGEIVFALSDGITDCLEKAKVRFEIEGSSVTQATYTVDELDPVQMKHILSTVPEFSPPEAYVQAIMTEVYQELEYRRVNRGVEGRALNEYSVVREAVDAAANKINQIDFLQNYRGLENIEFLHLINPDKMNLYHDFKNAASLEDFKLKKTALLGELETARTSLRDQYKQQGLSDAEKGILNKQIATLSRVYKLVEILSAHQISLYEDNPAGFKSCQTAYNDYLKNFKLNPNAENLDKVLELEKNAAEIEKNKKVKELESIQVKEGITVEKKGKKIVPVLAIGDDIIITASRVPIKVQEHLRAAILEGTEDTSTNNIQNAVDEFLKNPNFAKLDADRQKAAIEGIFGLLEKDHIPGQKGVLRYTEIEILSVKDKFLRQLAERNQDRVELLKEKNKDLLTIGWYRNLPTPVKIVANIFLFIPMISQVIKSRWNRAEVQENEAMIRKLEASTRVINDMKSNVKETLAKIRSELMDQGVANFKERPAGIFEATPSVFVVPHFQSQAKAAGKRSRSGSHTKLETKEEIELETKETKEEIELKALNETEPETTPLIPKRPTRPNKSSKRS